MTVIEAPAVRPRVELRDEHYLHALAWANEQRMDAGREPLTRLPVGVPNSVEHCTLARAVGRDIKAGGREWDTIGPFVARFDKRRYGWLIER